MLNNENSTVEEVMTSEKERIPSETSYTSTANEMSAQQNTSLGILLKVQENSPENEVGTQNTSQLEQVVHKPDVQKPDIQKSGILKPDIQESASPVIQKQLNQEKVHNIIKINYLDDEITPSPDFQEKVPRVTEVILPSLPETEEENSAPEDDEEVLDNHTRLPPDEFSDDRVLPSLAHQNKDIGTPNQPDIIGEAANTTLENSNSENSDTSNSVHRPNSLKFNPFNQNTQHKGHSTNSVYNSRNASKQNSKNSQNIQNNQNNPNTKHHPSLSTEKLKTKHLPQSSQNQTVPQSLQTKFASPRQSISTSVGTISLNSVFKSIDRAVETAKQEAEKQLQKQISIKQEQKRMEKEEQNEKLAHKRYTFKEMDDGQVFLAEYLGSTQIIAPNRIVTEQDRQNQAQLAVKRVKAPYDEKQPKIEVQLFISTQKFKVIDVDDDVIEVKDDETMMMHPLHSISYIADIGDLLVVIAKRHSTDPFEYDSRTTFHEYQEQKLQKFTCHVFQSIRQESQVISNCIGQAFNYAYREFLEMHGLGPDNMSHEQYRHMLDVHEIYHDDLNHYIKKENAKEIWITKFKSEPLGVVLVESGWGSIVPTFILANMKHGGPAEMSTNLSIGDQVMAVDGVSLVGLSMPKVQEIFKQLRTQTVVKVNIVNCPPTVTVRIRRPNTSVQLGFSVQAGIICSLMRGGIAEKGGVRVGHKIIEINAHSVVATSHEKIVGLLQNAVGEIIMKTMPAAMFRLLTGVDSPTYM